MNRIFQKTTQNVSKALDLFNGMTEREYKEEIKEDGGYKIEIRSKDEFDNKVKEKHEVKID